MARGNRWGGKYPQECSTIPGRKFDIDFVVVGAKGVIVVEVKNFTNRVCFENDEYFQEKDGRRIPLSPDDYLRLEVKKHTFALSKYLALNGFDEVVVKKILASRMGSCPGMA